jgi:copper homeostasis protein
MKGRRGEHAAMSITPVFEIPVDDPLTARAAARFADRLEVCRDLEAEGLTPDPDHVARIIESARADGHAPHIAVVFQELPPPEDRRTVGPADFAAGPHDLDRLAELVPAYAAVGAGSIVLGYVDASGEPDVETVRAAVEITRASGLDLAFHRAFDLAADPAVAARRLAELGVVRTLAAGCSGYDASVASLDDRVARLAIAATAVDPASFAVVPCGGVRSTNTAIFARATPHVHASCRRRPSPFELGVFDEEEAEALRHGMRRASASS